MIVTIYMIILCYFFLGGIGFFFIGRKIEPEKNAQNWIKLASYFVIINILFFSIVINPIIFRGLAILIIMAGIVEMFHLFRKSDWKRKGFFWLALFIFGILTFGFYVFSGMGKKLVLYTFLILSIFDSFSQITGQLWGRKKILPSISPQKTAEGLIGGTIIALLSALLLRNLVNSSPVRSLMLAAGIIMFSFAGDIAASYFKRKYNAKDFSRAIPGHGGILDRFDSLIAGGAWIALLALLETLLTDYSWIT